MWFPLWIFFDLRMFVINLKVDGEIYEIKKHSDCC